MKQRLLPFLIAVLPLAAEDIAVPGLRQPVEVLRDKWGIPHIYAQTAEDLFFAQGYITARDRLFQLDLWRRVNSGHLAEVLGEQAVARDRIARLVKFRGDWNAEWASYSPDAKQIATDFTRGINAYIQSLGESMPPEFAMVGYKPSQWQPEDVAARIAGLLMTRNLTREVQRAQDIVRFGLDTVQKYLPPDPPIRIEIPKDLDLTGITTDLLRDYNEAIGGVRFRPVESPALAAGLLPYFVPGVAGELQGSNNWVVSGARSVTGKPILANDPHRPINMPSLRKSVHLVGPGWNVIGAGEPALPGIALGHNEEVGFGFTIVGIDQVDLYVEKTNPTNPDQYLYKGEWKTMEVVNEPLRVRGEAKPRQVQLRYTIHGPVIAEDLGRHRVFALKWVGAEPGGAGYLAALRLSRTRNWDDFQKAAALYKVPSENLVYADRAGNIGWIASGMAPLRKNWSGLLPVPGHTGEYEWSGFLPGDQNPRLYNPEKGAIATANHNILPKNYPHQLAFEWAAGFRHDRIEEMLLDRGKFALEDFQRMQQDVHSHSARLFLAAARAWSPKPGVLSPREQQILDWFKNWDATLNKETGEALFYSLWTGKLHRQLFGPRLGTRVDLPMVLQTLHAKPRHAELHQAFLDTIDELDRSFGKDTAGWKWGNVHTVTFTHSIDARRLHRGPFPRPGDGNTVNSTSGANYRQTAGASYRQILDLSDWDRSVVTNVPGESGNPNSPHYDDLIEEWATGRYHPMLYTRKAVEAATTERIRLVAR